MLAALNSKYHLDFFVLENVMGLVTPKHVKRFKAILAAFDDAGFKVVFQTLNARSFGVPQNRPRLFIVGLNSSKYPEVKFSFPNGCEAETTSSQRQFMACPARPSFPETSLRGTFLAIRITGRWFRSPRSSRSLRSRLAGRSFRRLAWDEESPTVAYGNREIHIHPNGGRQANSV